MIEFLNKLKKFVVKYKILLSVIASVLLITAAVLILIFGKKEPVAAPVVPQENVITQPVINTVEIPKIELSVSSPESDDITTTSPTYTINGNADPNSELLLNGKILETNADGSFSYNAELKIGSNTFSFEQNGTTVSKTIRYRYIIIESIEPSDNKSYNSGSVVTVNVKARKESTVTATLGNNTINCNETNIKSDDETTYNDDNTFCYYSGSFALPSDNTENINLGKIAVTAKNGDNSETKYSGNITVKKPTIVVDSDTSVTPQGGNYINVGSGLVATIISRSAETFNGNTTDDDSNPANNYLPQGTMDYCAEGVVTNGSKEYYKLRCGKRVYSESNPGYSYSEQVVSVKEGKLPENNKLSISSLTTEGKYTVLKLDTEWKAPFYFELLNQNYQKSNKGFNVSSVTFSYVDITFCYANELNGEIVIPSDHPIFKSAEIIKNQYDYTLRLTLKKTGGFYGWDCYYDSEDKLTFKFLNPLKIENNELTGAKIFIDVGHGGSDTGALTGFTPKYTEAELNLKLAEVLKTELENLGATVVLARTNNSTYISPPARMNLLRDANADFCVAIHHDQNASSSPNGFLSAYFSPYSKSAADFIATRTQNANIYNKIWPVSSHYYYINRVTNCPVVLTENGFISNKNDYNGAINNETIIKKAKAIANGILDYFNSIK
ncbi:MAG: N-acetylmuramoyl-L-alanine amidase [Clostridia bacterium]|nr:N-acetylmuramoyl-L-alanine amidase [Clostridia bacterium]